MDLNKLKQEAEEWLNKWELCNKCENKVDCISNFSYCKKVVLQSYLASAEPREKQIQALGERCLQLQKDKGNLTDRVRELEAENEQIKNSDTLCKIIGEQKRKIDELEAQIEILERRIIRAKECMKKLLFIINSEPSNYNCKGLVRDAEDFIYNRTCNIRKSGNHCITNEPCIMCDK